GENDPFARPQAHGDAGRAFERRGDRAGQLEVLAVVDDDRTSTSAAAPRREPRDRRTDQEQAAPHHAVHTVTAPSTASTTSSPSAPAPSNVLAVTCIPAFSTSWSPSTVSGP